MKIKKLFSHPFKTLLLMENEKIINLKSCWNLDNDLLLSLPYTGKAVLMTGDNKKLGEVNIFNRQSLNSILKLLKIYTEWTEFEKKIKLDPFEVRINNKCLILKLNLK